MADLIAQGRESQQRWRHALAEDQPFVLGRGTGPGQVDWDSHVSRHHAEICYQDGRLEVRRMPSARNPIFFGGSAQEHFFVEPGDHFVIGQTSFTLSAEQVDIMADMPAPARQEAFTTEALRRVRYRNADFRLEVLSRVPEVIGGAANDRELYARLMNMLLAGIPRADAVALVAGDADQPDDTASRVLAWDRRRSTESSFRPSGRLIRESVRTDQSILHTWEPDLTESQQQFTLTENFDWAFCTPVPGDYCRGWVLYVAGTFADDRALAATPSDPRDLRDDIKFCELVAATLGSLRQVRALQGQNSVLSQFFSPVVLDALGAQDPDVALAPLETDVVVLFCDLRGFSRRAEQSGENLLGLLERVSRALGVMTRHIREFGGVVGDYQGDAAMGFWGWPLVQADAISRACLAALSIRVEFAAAAMRPGDPLSDFRMGIGIATGRAVAGKIGTDDQVKVTVFGPVVNLASRLEGMTKILRAPILLDHVTAAYVRDHVPSDQARCRRVAVVRPYGLDAAVEVAELLPPADEFPQLTDDDLANYEAALDALLARDWSKSFELLHKVSPADRVKDFLTVYIAQHNRTPPVDWDGVIPLSSKS